MEGGKRKVWERGSYREEEQWSTKILSSNLISSNFNHLLLSHSYSFSVSHSILLPHSNFPTHILLSHSLPPSFLICLHLFHSPSISLFRAVMYYSFDHSIENFTFYNFYFKIFPPKSDTRKKNRV